MVWEVAAGLAGDIGGALIGANSAQNVARQNRQWQARQYAKRYQVTVQDLQKAGLNPMLAYMGQGGAGAGSPGHGSQAEPMRLEGLGSKAVANYLQSQMLKSSIALNTATAKKAVADAGKSDAERVFIEGAQTSESSARSSQYSAQVAEIAKRIEQMSWEISRGQQLLPHEIEKLNADIRNVNASAVPKEMLGELAGMAMDVLRTLKDPKTPPKARSLLKDTVNAIDDALNRAPPGHSAGVAARQKMSEWANKYRGRRKQW